MLTWRLLIGLGLSDGAIIADLCDLSAQKNHNLVSDCRALGGVDEGGMG